MRHILWIRIAKRCYPINSRTVGHPKTNHKRITGTEQTRGASTSRWNAWIGGRAGTAIVSSKSLREPSFQELSQLRCRPKLRNRVEFLER